MDREPVEIGKELRCGTERGDHVLQMVETRLHAKFRRRTRRLRGDRPQTKINKLSNI